MKQLFMAVCCKNWPGSSFDDVVHAQDHLGRLGCAQQHLPLHLEALGDAQIRHVSHTALGHVWDGTGQRSEQARRGLPSHQLCVCVCLSYPGRKWSCCPGGRLSAGTPALRCHILRYQRWWWAAATTHSLKASEQTLIHIHKLTDAEMPPRLTKIPPILQMQGHKKHLYIHYIIWYS